MVWIDRPSIHQFRSLATYGQRWCHRSPGFFSSGPMADPGVDAPQIRKKLAITTSASGGGSGVLRRRLVTAWSDYQEARNAASDGHFRVSAKSAGLHWDYGLPAQRERHGRQI